MEGKEAKVYNNKSYFTLQLLSLSFCHNLMEDFQMKTVIEPNKQYREPRIVELGDAVAMTLSFGQSFVRDLRGRFPVNP